MAAVSASVPVPDLVSEPEPAMTLAAVRVVPESVFNVPPLAPSVTPRLLSSIANEAVLRSAPPFNVSWSAVGLAGSLPKRLMLPCVGRRLSSLE